MKAVLIETVERLVKDLYRQVSLTHEQYRELMRARRPRDVVPEERSRTSPANLAEHRRKILDAYYDEAITLDSTAARARTSALTNRYSLE